MPLRQARARRGTSVGDAGTNAVKVSEVAVAAADASTVVVVVVTVIVERLEPESAKRSL